MQWKQMEEDEESDAAVSPMQYVGQTTIILFSISWYILYPI